MKVKIGDVTRRYVQPVPFEELDHTADAAVRVRGVTPEETLARLVLAFATLVTAGEPVEAGATKTIQLGPDERSALAVDVLRELLFELDVHRVVPRACSVETCDPERGARVLVELGPFDAELHAEGLVLKAVTWHEARFARDAGSSDEPWRAEIVFDV